MASCVVHVMTRHVPVPVIYALVSLAKVVREEQDGAKVFLVHPFLYAVTESVHNTALDQLALDYDVPDVVSAQQKARLNC